MMAARTLRHLLWGILLLAAAAPAELPDFTALVERNVGAVVNISTLYRGENRLRHYEPSDALPFPQEGPWGELFRRFLGEESEALPEEVESLGSGFIISPDGYILTNHHVVDGADRIIVHLNNRDTYEARLIGSDPDSDIALLKVQADGLPTVKIGDSRRLKIGAWVLAIGSPFGFDATVTAGIVSAKGRSLPSENYVPYIQTDVAINPGNSGGPLFNLDGEVVGVNAQIFSRSGGFMGLSFAVPIELAMNVARQLKEKGRVSRGYLGVLIQDLDLDLARAFGLDHPAGALVARVLPDSPAAQAGLQVGDVVLGFNDTPIQRSTQLPPLVGAAPVGQAARLRVHRNGRAMELEVVIRELPQESADQETAPASPAAPPQGDRWGLVVDEPTAEERAQLELDQGGVVVRRIDGPLAAQAGIEVGDAIVMIDGRPVTGPAHYRQLLAALEGEGATPVLVHKPTGPLFVALPGR